MTAIVPVLLILVGGVVLRRTLLREAAFWRGLERLTYFLLGPALFVTSISEADLSAVEPAPLVLATTLPIIAATGLLVTLRRPLRASGPALGSMVQGAIRINTYIGLVFAQSMHGSSGVATFALACAVAVPTVNVLCVSVLTIYGHSLDDAPRPRLLRELATNPLILSCIAGLCLNITGVALPTPIAATLDLAASPALLCGTLVAGATIEFTARRRDILDVSLVSMLKLVALPAAAGAIAVLAGADPLTRDALVLLAAVPTAPSAAILAARLGGDTRLMASTIGVQTLLATWSMPLMLQLAPQAS